MACSLDKHPLIADINDYLKDGKPLGDIRDHCVKHDAEAPKPYQLSRHATGCLKLPPRETAFKKAKEEIPPDLEVPPLGELRNLALAVFYWRLKNNPSSVQTRELVPILTKILQMEAGEKAKDPMDEFLTLLNEQNGN